MREFRCIVFTEQEVLKAIIERRRRMRERLPAGTVQGLTYETKGNGPILTNIRIVDDHGRKHNLEIQALELGAALVEYCLNQQVRLPSSSSKWIEIISDTDLTLFVAVDPEEGPEPPMPEDKASPTTPRQRRRRQP